MPGVASVDQMGKEVAQLGELLSEIRDGNQAELHTL